MSLYDNVVSGGCVECPVEPRQIGWVTAGVASKTAFTIPERVVTLPTVAITVEMLAYKGWWCCLPWTQCYLMVCCVQ